MATETLRPNAAGDYTNLTPVDSATNWENVDEASADDDTTYNYGGTTQVKDAYALADTAIPAGSTINSVTVYFRCKKIATAWRKFQPFLRLGTDETAGTNLEVQGTAGYDTYNEALARPGGGDWAVSDLDSLQVAIGCQAETGSARCTQIYVEVDYTPAVTEKTSSDAGSGVESKVLSAILVKAETGSGVDTVDSLQTPTAKSASDTGSGTESTPLPSAILTDSETGSGIEAPIARVLAAADTGGGVEASNIEIEGLLKNLFASELGEGSDCLTAKIEMPTKGGGMRLWT
jgi:hypothetical protein